MFICLFSLLGNPVTTKPHYRQYVINKVPQIRILDFRKVGLKVRWVFHVILLFYTQKKKLFTGTNVRPIR